MPRGGGSGLAKKRPLKLSSAVVLPHAATCCRRRVKVAGAVHHSIVAVLDLVILKDGLHSLGRQTIPFHYYLV